MTSRPIYKAIKALTFGLILSMSVTLQAQEDPAFWDRVRFGGSLGVSVGSGFADILVAPSALYSFNQYLAAGTGLQLSHVRVDDYKSWMYGASLIGIVSPVEEVQVSVELEQMRVSNTFDEDRYPGRPNETFWNTALYFGLGYNSGDVTVGVRYNVLFDKDRFAYNDAFMPFVRVYF
ncbi:MULTISPECIES: hypothetical protein [unclassified Flavobacterium]|uniref:hypothetical protein n=1 Tax=unclassified Flavobacterium TaxID=196869 RepID=UPI001F139D41|nr:MULTISPECIES: hypothetical protein [unclassified Flavobacterium]UMY66603.1 hypothetical protein MKO97_04250 [Flavobacterium sp. HJ-32-4]